MTVSSEVNRSDFAGNGSTTNFATGFRFLQNADIKVILTVTATGVETAQVLDTDYTLTGAGLDAGGTVVMTVAPATGTTLTIKRDIALTQLTDYVENDPFPAESHEEALDKVTMLVQQQQEELDRSLKLSESQQSSGLQIPAPVEDSLLRWDANGDLINVTVQQLGTIADAGDLPYSQGDTGALSRTVESRLRDFVSLKDFVTDSTGVSDVTSEVQAALNTAKVIDTGWPSNKYLCGSLTVPANTIITGRGEFKVAVGLTDSWMKNASFPSGDAGIVLENFSVDGNKAARSDTEITISMQQTDSLEISKVKVRDSAGKQISITGGTTKNLLIEKCVAKDGDSDGIDVNGVIGDGNRVLYNVTSGHPATGLVLQGGTKFVTAIGNISNDNGTTNGNGISAGQSNQCVLIGNQAHRNSSIALAGSGIGLNPSSGDCEQHILIGNLCRENGDDGIDCAPGSGATSRYHVIMGNVLGANVRTGWNEAGAGIARNCAIIGNMARGNGTVGIQLDNAGNNTVIGNQSLDNGQITADSPAIRANSDKNVVVANLVDNILGSTQTNISLNGDGEICFANMLGIPSTGDAISIVADNDHLIGYNSGFATRKPTQTAIVVSGTTPDFKGGEFFQMTNGGPVSVSAPVAGHLGQEISVEFTDGNTTLIHGTPLRLNGGVNFVPNQNDIMTFKYQGTGWWETGRNDN
jgi:parallel beta-helix repeat protein